MIEQMIGWLLGFLVLILPLFFYPGVWFAFEPPKVVFFQLMVLVSFLVWCLGKKKNVFKKNTDLKLILFIWFLVIFLTSILGFSFKRSFWGSEFRLFGILTFLELVVFALLVGGISEEKKNREKIIFFLTAGSFLVGLGAVYQMVLMALGKDVLTYAGRVMGSLGQPNWLGGYQAAVLPFVFWEIKRNKGLGRIFFSLVATVLLVSIILSFSRSALFSLSLMAFLGVILWQVREGKNIALSLLPLLMCLFLFLILNKSRVFVNASFLEDRFSIWKAAGEAVLKRPFLGHGMDNIDKVISGIYFLRLRGVHTHYIDRAHNLFLDIWLFSGVGGLLSFLIVLRIFFGKTIKFFLKKGDFLVFCLILSTIGFLIFSQIETLSIAHLMVFFLNLGLVLGLDLSLIGSKSRDRMKA
jgi:O-antigen ligase